MPRLVLYTAPGCHLCERARATILEARRDVEFEMEEIDITADADLEARYRELLPVVEIDGRRAFAYFVRPDALRRALAH